jgi:hypothetical protein
MKSQALIVFCVVSTTTFLGFQISKPASAQVTGERQIMRMDADGDGKVSKAEFRGRKLRFEDIDTNNDGFATVEEFDNAISKFRATKNQSQQTPTGMATTRGQTGDAGQRTSGQESAKGSPRWQTGGGGADANGPPFLQKAEIENLVKGTLFSHNNVIRGSTTHLDFRADGTVVVQTQSGRTDHAKWFVQGRAALCVQYSSVLEGRKICNFAKRNGKELKHYHIKTREPSPHDPWIIVRPGPNVSQVRNMSFTD